MKVKASKEQKEGVARVFDTLTASAVIAAIVGATGHGVISGAEMVALVSSATILLVFSWILRSPPK